MKFALQKGISKNTKNSRYKDYLFESRKLHYLKRIKDKEMISRGHDFFSKSHINNPMKWWQKSKTYLRNMKLKASLVKNMKSLKKLMMIFYNLNGKKFRKIRFLIMKLRTYNSKILNKI